MIDYLVAECSVHHIKLYRVGAASPKDAMDIYSSVAPFSEYDVDSIYGNGAVVILYSIAEVGLKLVNCFLKYKSES